MPEQPCTPKPSAAWSEPQEWKSLNRVHSGDLIPSSLKEQSCLECPLLDIWLGRLIAGVNLADYCPPLRDDCPWLV